MIREIHDVLTAPIVFLWHQSPFLFLLVVGLVSVPVALHSLRRRSS